MKTTGYNSWASWLAAVACFVIGMLLFVPMRLAGLFFVVFQEGYGIDRDLATLPSAVFCVLSTLIGPFTAYFGEIFGLRSTTIVGCVMSAIGVGGCYFVEDITTITIFLGFIYGIGLALGGTLLPTILQQHFNKDINFVMGTLFTGICIGAAIMPPVIEYLIRQYGNPGMFLILSAITLNSVPAAILLKDPKNDKVKSPLPGQMAFVLEKEHTKSDKIFTLGRINYECEITDLGDIKKDESNGIGEGRKLYTKESRDLTSGFQSTTSVVLDTSQFHFLNNEAKQNNCRNSQHVEIISFSQIDSFSYKQDFERATGDNITEKNIPTQTSNSNESVNSRGNSKSKMSCESFWLFADPTFHITMFVQSMHGFVSTLYWTVLMDFAKDEGFSDDSSILFLMFLPIAEIFGNMCLNWITDHGFMTLTNYSMICYFIMGINSIYMLWAVNFSLMMVGVLMFGLISASLRTTFPGMIFEHIENDQQSMAIASRFTLYALLCFSKTPIIGYFRTTLGSYDWVYYIMGICSFASGVFVMFTPVLASYRRKSRTKN